MKCTHCAAAPAATNGLCLNCERATFLALFVAHRTARDGERQRSVERVGRKRAERKAS